jgi:hypothetical protein
VIPFGFCNPVLIDDNNQIIAGRVPPIRDARFVALNP